MHLKHFYAKALSIHQKHFPPHVSYIGLIFVSLIPIMKCFPPIRIANVFLHIHGELSYSEFCMNYYTTITCIMYGVNSVLDFS